MWKFTGNYSMVTFVKDFRTLFLSVSIGHFQSQIMYHNLTKKKTTLLIFSENDKSKRNGSWRNSLKTVWNWHCSFYVTFWPNIKVLCKFLYCFWPGINFLFFLPKENFFFFFFHYQYILFQCSWLNLLGLMIWLVLKIEQSCQELCVICGGHRLLWS